MSRKEKIQPRRYPFVGPTNLFIGYTRLYEGIMEDLTKQEFWWGLIVFFYANATFGLILVLIASTIYVSDFEHIDAVLKGLAFLLYIVFVYGIVFGAVVGIITGLSNKNIRLNELTARLLISEPKPYKDGSGLSCLEIERLSELSRIEQSSADWRGSFVAVAVWGAILGLLGWTLDKAGLDVISQPKFDTLLANPNAIVIMLFWIAFWTVLVLIAIKFSWQITEYVGTFFGRESANRTILLVCQEAVYILHEKGLSKKDSLSIDEKTSLEQYLNCRIVTKEEGSNLIYKKSFVFSESNENIYYLFLDVHQKKTKPLKIERKKIKVTLPKFIDSVKTTFFNKVNQWWRRK